MSNRTEHVWSYSAFKEIRRRKKRKFWLCNNVPLDIEIVVVGKEIMSERITANKQLRGHRVPSLTRSFFVELPKGA